MDYEWRPSSILEANKPTAHSDAWQMGDRDMEDRKGTRCARAAATRAEDFLMQSDRWFEDR